jgi:small-conductance mechanosensitive channel
LSFSDIWLFPLIRLGDGNEVLVSQLVLAATFLIIGIFIDRRLESLLGRQLHKRQLNPDAIQTAQRALFYSVLVVLLITTLGLLNIPITAMAFATGAIAIGVGFGAQAVINNWISGWILMTERPVRIGDFIEIDGSKGVVERIGNRSTQIRRTDGVHLMVPNSQMLERTVVNWTLVDHKIRTHVSVGVAYGSPVRRFRGHYRVRGAR